jgi:Flp pilus assembly protein TadG
MQRRSRFLAEFASVWARRAHAFLRDRRANVAVLSALMVLPLTGAMGLAVEVSDWFLTSRAMQNAADSAAISAATNGGTKCSSGTAYSSGTLSCSNISSHCSTAPGTFDCEAVATASGYSFSDGANTVTVTAAYTKTGCPTGATACYDITIQKTLPVTFMTLLGHGSTQLVKANAWARAVSPVNKTYCILALVGEPGSSNPGTDGITQKGGGNGSSNTNCNIASDGSTNCNNTNHAIAGSVDAVGTPDPNCAGGVAADAQQIKTPILDTNYRNLAANIPTSGAPCPTMPSGGTAANPKTLDLSAHQVYFCNGDLTLASKSFVSVTTGVSGAVIVIKNGGLNLNGGTFQEAAGQAGVSLIFTGNGAPTAAYPYGAANGSTLSIYGPPAAVTGTTWNGVAIYIDPATTKNVDLNLTGNSPVYDVTGLVYMPNTNLALGGDIGWASTSNSNAQDCLVLVVNTMAGNGNWIVYPGKVSSQDQCPAAGVQPPETTISNANLALIQ